MRAQMTVAIKNAAKKALLDFRGAWRAGRRSAAVYIAAWMILGGAVSGCAGKKLAPSGGGVAPGDAAAVSAVVAQTRAQFPKLSASGVNYITREAPGKWQGQSPKLVLTGAGVGVAPGIQVSARVPMECELYLSKPGYDRGYALLSFEGKKQERWRIVAHDHRGRADGEFEFIYLLASPRGELWYLAVIGGGFEQGGGKFRGMEGTLIVPGEDGTVSKWKRAFKIDFGIRQPAIPAYRKMVDEAQEKFKKLRRRLPKLQTLRKRIARSRAQLDVLLNVPDKRQAAQSGGKNIAAAEEKARLDQLLADQQQQAEAAGRELTAYFQLRETIAGEYADFLRSNPYTWAPRAGRQRYHDAWKEVELHHPEIDEISNQVVAYIKDPGAVEQARGGAMAAVRRHNNWGKDPSRAIPAR